MFSTPSTTAKKLLTKGKEKRKLVKKPSRILKSQKRTKNPAVIDIATTNIGAANTGFANKMSLRLYPAVMIEVGLDHDPVYSKSYVGVEVEFSQFANFSRVLITLCNLSCHKFIFALDLLCACCFRDAQMQFS